MESVNTSQEKENFVIENENPVIRLCETEVVYEEVKEPESEDDIRNEEEQKTQKNSKDMEDSNPIKQKETNEETEVIELLNGEYDGGSLPLPRKKPTNPSETVNEQPSASSSKDKPKRPYKDIFKNKTTVATIISTCDAPITEEAMELAFVLGLDEERAVGGISMDDYKHAWNTCMRRMERRFALKDAGLDPYGLTLLTKLLANFSVKLEEEGKRSKTKNASVELLELYKEMIEELEEVEDDIANEVDRAVIEEKFRQLKSRVRKTTKRHNGKKYQREFRARLNNKDPKDLAGEFEKNLSFHMKNFLKRILALQKRYKSKLYQREKRDQERIELKRLERAVRYLQEVVSFLEAYKAWLKNRLAPYEGRLDWKVRQISDYFNIFKYGISLKSNVIRETQVDFVKSNMVNGIAFDIGGTKADFYQQWEMVSALMPNYSLWVNNIDSADLNGNLLYCNVSVTFRITRSFIATLYPHMLSDEEFVSSVVGKTMFIEGYAEFFYAQSEKTIIKIKGESYMVSGWMKLLHNSKLVDKVMYNKDLKFRSDGLIEATEVIDVEDEVEDYDNVYEVY